SQVPWGVDALGGTISEPAWRSKPSWYLVTTEDRMIPPPAQREMSARAGSTVVEVAGSHSIYVSQPTAVAGKGCFRSAITCDRVIRADPPARSPRGRDGVRVFEGPHRAQTGENPSWAGRETRLPTARCDPRLSA